MTQKGCIMPTYDYRCEADGQIYEVKHAMSETVSNWGELCQRTGMEVGEIAAETKVTRLATGGNLVSSANLGDKAAPCGAPGGCAGSACGLN
jgi:hypothetical protein